MGKRIQTTTPAKTAKDEPQGFGERRLVKQDGDSRLRRRLLAIEKLDVTEKRQVLELLDAFIECGQLRRKAESRT